VRRPLETIDAGELYRRHSGTALRRARWLLGSEEDASEAVQHVFLGLVERPEQIERFPSFVAWLYSAITHFCLNQLRNRRTRARLLAMQVAPARERVAPARVETLVTAAELLDRLDPVLAEVAVYHYVDEMTHDEIAHILGCSRRHVGDLLARARASGVRAGGGEEERVA
jgi:RNA polymerase sigma factor (sigma-70 family)